MKEPKKTKYRLDITIRPDDTPSWKLFVDHDFKLFESLTNKEKSEFISSLERIIKFYKDVSINTNKEG